MKKIFIIFILINNIIYSQTCKTNYDCYNNQYCDNYQCKDNNFLISSKIKSQIEYNKEINIYNALGLGLSLYFNNKNDWNKIILTSELFLNKYFSQLAFIKIGLSWDYEIYFFDIHPYFGLASNLIYDFNENFIISFDLNLGIVYSFSKIHQGFKLGMIGTSSLYYSTNKKTINPVISPNIFLSFEF